MKKFYVSPAIEVTAFVAEDILCASSISVDGLNYDVVNNGIAVDADTGVQSIEGSAYTNTTYTFN